MVRRHDNPIKTHTKDKCLDCKQSKKQQFFFSFYYFYYYLRQNTIFCMECVITISLPVKFQ